MTARSVLTLALTFALMAGLFTAQPALPASAGDEARQDGFAGDVPHLLEEAAAAGIDHRYTGPWEFFVGGGAASFDCNGDRRPDLFLAGGTSPAALYVNISATGGPLAFSRADAGIAERDLTAVLGAYPIDLDNDRHTDLVLLRLGRNLILRGRPDCRFEVANRAFALAGGRGWTTAFSAIWERDATFPTLAFGDYVERSAPGSPWGTCGVNRLIRPGRNPADARLPDYGAAFSLDPGHCALSMLFTEWNRSGVPALRITNDRHYYRGGQEQLWSLAPGRPPRQFSASQGWKTLKIWGMGIAEADLDADGLPEYALTSMGDTKLQTLDEEVVEEDRPTYRDIAYEMGATAQRPYVGDEGRPSTGWHAAFADLNNDANLDLFIAKGNVEAMPDFAAFDPDNLLMGGFDGRFRERGAAAGIARDTKGRGGAVDDFNMDGMLDLLLVNREEPASLFRNAGARTLWGHRPLGNWLKIELDNGAINPDAVGAKISVRTGTRTQVRRIGIGGGHASGRLGFVHLGLGVAERATIRVEWPDGAWSHPYRVFANQHVRIARGAEIAEYWYPE